MECFSTYSGEVSQFGDEIELLVYYVTISQCILIGGISVVIITKLKFTKKILDYTL